MHSEMSIRFALVRAQNLQSVSLMFTHFSITFATSAHFKGPRPA